MTSVDTTAVAPLDELALLRAVTLGEYEIHGELGRGGMAAVYLAHEIALDRKVAIKVITSNLGNADDLVERFRREARTAASLSHPNIIPIYAVRDVEGLLFFVMKLVDGRPLDSVVRDAAPLPVSTVQAIFSQVGSAVGYAHRRGVVHRDIKPGNILVDDEGWCVVTDFGIAKVAESVGLTTSGMMVGTPSYMSPEQCLGKDVGPASDQYALGVVAYELLTGKLPFPGTSMMSVMYAHVNTPAPAVEELRSDIPADIAAAVMRMLEKEPEDRFPNLETAVAAMGSLTQSQDETTRSQLITLAKSGTRPLVVRHSTPRSPIPLNRTPAPTGMATPAPTTLTPAPVATRKSQLPIAVAIVGGAILIAVALMLRGQRRDAANAAEAAAAPAVAAPTTTTPPSTGTPAVAVVGAPATPEPVPAPPPVAETPKQKADRLKKTGGANTATGATPQKDARGAARPETLAARPQITAVANVDMEEPGPAAAAPAAPLSGSAALLNTPRGPAVPGPEVQRDIERAVTSYAQALASGDAGAAAAAWPDMPEFRRQQLMKEFGEGLRYSTRWRVSDLQVDGGKATARLRGTTTDVRNGQLDGSRTVDESISFVRKGSTWRLKQIAQ
jgi:serine/threonine-protein kinase